MTTASTALHMVFAQEKDCGTLGAKVTPLAIGAGGTLIVSSTR